MFSLLIQLIMNKLSKAVRSVMVYMYEWSWFSVAKSFDELCGYNPAATAAWNSLPPAVINCDTLCVFKSRL